ncbi:hypothetical protein BD413DRAFT_514754 [Trametes elegans]|nr:hypothetical protein BD413DRAFT_514754 [Trametes elegans]
MAASSRRLLRLLLLLILSILPLLLASHHLTPRRRPSPMTAPYFSPCSLTTIINQAFAALSTSASIRSVRYHDCDIGTVQPLERWSVDSLLRLLLKRSCGSEKSVGVLKAFVPTTPFCLRAPAPASATRRRNGPRSARRHLDPFDNY